MRLAPVTSSCSQARYSLSSVCSGSASFISVCDCKLNYLLVLLVYFWSENLWDMPHDKPHWLTYKDWAEKFGDIIYLEVFGKRMVTA